MRMKDIKNNIPMVEVGSSTFSTLYATEFGFVFCSLKSREFNDPEFEEVDTNNEYIEIAKGDSRFGYAKRWLLLPPSDKRTEWDWNVIVEYMWRGNEETKSKFYFMEKEVKETKEKLAKAEACIVRLKKGR